MYIFKIIFILLAIIFPVATLAYLVEYIKLKYRKSANKSDFFNPFRYKSIIVVLFLTLISVFIVNISFTEPVFKDSEKKIEYGKKRNLPSMVKSGYEELLTNDFKNIDLHYEYINWHFKQSKQTRQNDLSILRNDNNIFNLYSYLKFFNNDTLKKIGVFGHAYCLYKINKFSKSIWELKQKNTGNFKYKNFIIALSYLRLKNTERAEEYFHKEIQYHNGFKKGAVSGIIKLYLSQKNTGKILTFASDKANIPYISGYDLKKIYAIQFDIISFIKKYFELISRRIDTIGLIAAFLICITWLYYIKRIDIYEQEKWHNIIVILLMGMFFSSFSNFATSLSEYYLNIRPDGNIINDFVYTTVNNGMIEEIVKILPLIFLLIFTNTINEPYDYILYASASALGFAFIENLIYFDSSSLHILHGRALISVVGHMVNSSIIAYGLILAKYKNNMSAVVAFIIYYLIASLAHGVYNILLIHSMQVIFIIYYLFLIRIWTTFINNSLNNSTFFDYKIKMGNDKLQFYLVTSLTSILIFEYFTMGWIYGNKVANSTFIDTSAMGSILILFLSTRLSKFDLVKKHWGIIDYRINPFLFKTYPLNFVGYKIKIDCYYKSGYLAEIITESINGKITDRIMVHNESVWSFKKRKTERNWFMIKLDKPINIQKGDKDFILLKFRSRQPKLKTEKDLLAQLLIIKDINKIKNGNVSRLNLKRIGGVIVNLIAVE